MRLKQFLTESTLSYIGIKKMFTSWVNGKSNPNDIKNAVLIYLNSILKKIKLDKDIKLEYQTNELGHGFIVTNKGINTFGDKQQFSTKIDNSISGALHLYVQGNKYFINYVIAEDRKGVYFELSFILKPGHGFKAQGEATPQFLENEFKSFIGKIK